MVFHSPRDEKLSFWTLLQVYLRSFFTQGSFSISYRQNIGFAFCIEPAGIKIWKEEEARRKFYLRHLEYYNGNPFMATLVLGAVIRMEERLRDGDGIAEDDINRFKAAVGQAVGSVGDRLFWRTMRPFALTLGLIVAYIFGVAGAFVFLALFNLPVFYLKWRWLIRGYELGPRVVIEIKNPNIDFSSSFMEAAGSAVLSFLLVGFLAAPAYHLSPVALGAGALFLLRFILPQSWIPPSILFIISAALAVLMGRVI